VDFPLSHITAFVLLWESPLGHSAERSACSCFYVPSFASAQRYCSTGLTDNRGSFRVGACAQCICICKYMWFRKTI